MEFSLQRSIVRLLRSPVCTVVAKCQK